MKKMVLIGVTLALSGCALFQSSKSTTDQGALFMSTCLRYEAALTEVFSLRDQLTTSQREQLRLVDAAISPLCLGPVPADPTAATQQITAALTTLGVLEMVLHGGTK